MSTERYAIAFDLNLPNGNVVFGRRILVNENYRGFTAQEARAKTDALSGGWSSRLIPIRSYVNHGDPMRGR